MALIINNTNYPYGYFQIKENVINDAKKYSNQLQWRRASPGAFASARKHGWINEACAHMVTRCHWTQENLIADAKQYKSPSDWKLGNPSGYGTACRLKLLTDLTQPPEISEAGQKRCGWH